jgi:hypothetical protein
MGFMLPKGKFLVKTDQKPELTAHDIHYIDAMLRAPPDGFTVFIFQYDAHGI